MVEFLCYNIATQLCIRRLISMSALLKAIMALQQENQNCDDDSDGVKEWHNWVEHYY